MEVFNVITIKRLSQCSLDDILKAWNDGFEGYSAPVQMDMDSFLTRLVSEGLSPSLSLVAYSSDNPIGIVLSGSRMINGKKVAWNGGTAVAKNYRHQGVGKLLMEELFTLYKQEGVEIATLEAIYDNEKAISLYKSLGYKVIDELHYLEHKGNIGVELESNYVINSIPASQLESISFYKGMNPWQTHWNSAKGADVIVALDANKEIVGYAYYRHSYDAGGKHVGTVLFQCEAISHDRDEVIKSFLHYMFDESNELRVVIPNLPVTDSQETYEFFIKIGFTSIAKQVYMMKDF
ncbi:GNAT family N-acetyltransferase [Bacillus sp. BGMRC 2118]|nr:GNAT family N-acetyltransferase [Bacillus sp. BGMRC 2118]